MSDVLSQFGVSSDTLNQQAKPIRQRVNNRVAHIDGDFMAYQIAAVTNDEKMGRRPMRTLEYKERQVEDYALMLMEKVGASSFVLHVTPSASTKGGRADQAVQAEYQASRADTAKPADLDYVRGYIGTGQWQHGKGVAHLIREADDGMAMAVHADPKNAIICSADKDLRMVGGLYYDMTHDEIYEIEAGSFGQIELVVTNPNAKTPTKKLVGHGTAFFWAQMLMGDSVDNIPGLVAISGYDTLRLNKPDEFKKLITGLQKAQASGEEDLIENAKARTSAKFLKTKSVGAVGAYELLKDVTNDRDAFNLVKELFTNLEVCAKYTYRHWKTDVQVTPTQAMLGDMRCLWMRRSDNPDDVLAWLRTVI